MEKFCPACGQVYDDDATHCAADDERLVMLRPEPNLTGRVVDDKYEITDKLGEGGMGTVYLAYHATMDREVAIKVLKPQYSQNKLAIKRFHREARAASKLAHPNTITVYDSGQTQDGLLYQVMEKLSGRPVGDILDEDGPIEPERAIRIMAQVCDSLAEAHFTGITHRDLKPENIFIEPKFGNPDFVKVLDFGIAKMSETNVTQATATGMICGTPSYMSPEQAMGRELDGRSDIYALGVLLFEMITCQRPFEGDTPMEVMLKHISGELPPLPQGFGGAYREGLEHVIQWSLAKHAAERPADCQILKAALLDILERPAPITAPEVTTSGATLADARAATRDPALEKTGISSALLEATVDVKPPSRRRGLWIAAAALLVLAVGAGGTTAWWFTTQPADGGPEEARALAAETAPGVGTTDDTEGSEAATAAGPGLAVQVAPEAAQPDPGEGIGRALAEAVSAAPAVAEPAAPASLEVEITSDPQGAAVLDAASGDELGVTPLTLQRAAGVGAGALTLRRDGYEDAALTIDADVKRSYAVSLVQDKKKRRASSARKPPRADAATKTTDSEPKPKAGASAGASAGKGAAPDKGGKPGKDKGQHGFGTF